MSRNLEVIDKVYARLNSYASAEEKLKYCKNLLARTEVFMVKNRDNLTDHMLVRSSDIIESVKLEIQKLSFKKHN